MISAIETRIAMLFRINPTILAGIIKFI